MVWERRSQKVLEYLPSNARPTVQHTQPQYNKSQPNYCKLWDSVDQLRRKPDSEMVVKLESECSTKVLSLDAGSNYADECNQ